MTHITIEKEKLKQVLEALESCEEGHITDGGHQWHDAKLVDKAIDIVKQAQTAPTVQEPSEMDLQKCWVEKSDGTIDGIASMRLAIRKYSTTPPAAQPAPVQPVSGVVLRDGYPTLIQDKHIKETDQRLCIIPPAPEK